MSALSKTSFFIVAALLASPASAQSAVPQDPPTEIAEDHPLYQNFSPKVLQGAKRDADREPLPDADMALGVLQTGDIKSWPRLWRQGDWLVSGSLTGTLGFFQMGNNEFAPPAALNPSHDKINPGWMEAFLEPGVTFQFTPTAETKFYGGFAYMETVTRGTDYGGVTNTYHGLPEILHAGVHWHDAARGLSLDASYGQQDFAVGNNLLIASGASNGAQRGADYLGPRSAWANAAVVKSAWHSLAVQAFWLKPNDAPADATGTRLAGIDVDWGAGTPLELGFMYVRPTRSDIVTRADLDVYDARAMLRSSADSPHWSVRGEYVAERKSGVSASGWYVEGTFHATTTAWQPLMMLRYASFSGDRPGTPTWEGFDPLYFGGSNPDWYQGKVLSSIVNNTNVNSVAASLTLTPDEHTILQLVYLNFAVAEVNSPIDIPAANMAPPVGGGLPAKALANELDAIYTYTFNKNVNINVFAGYALPGAGYRQLYSANGGSASDWWILGTQFNISY